MSDQKALYTDGQPNLQDPPQAAPKNLLRKEDAKAVVQTALAIAVCRISRAALRGLRRGGTALPGRLAMRFREDILAVTSRGVETILVTGTNGKTTTAGMLAHAMEKAGRPAVCNRSGANLLSGVTAEFTAAADLHGRPGAKYAVIECDEGALHQVAPLLRPHVIVVTNLFRDQLDRYGEVMHTLDAVRRGIRSVPEAVLCLNADDSLTASLALDVPNPVVWFGIDETAVPEVRNSGRMPDPGGGMKEGDGLTAENPAEAGDGLTAENPAETGDGLRAGNPAETGNVTAKGAVQQDPPEEISDARYCIRCGAEYTYRFRTYAHLGDFCCPACGYARPVPDVAVTSIDGTWPDGSAVHMRVRKKTGNSFGKTTESNTGNSPGKTSGNSTGNSFGKTPGSAAPKNEFRPAATPGGNDCTACEAGRAPGRPGPGDLSREIPVRIGLPALYNIYNAAAALTAYSAAGLPLQEILDALADVHSSFGRMEAFCINGVQIRVILVKNPAGCSQALDYLCSLGEPFRVALGLNDRDADGHDISWIWDVDYEKLCSQSRIRGFYVWGDRAEDMQLRLKYAGADTGRIRLISGRDAKSLVNRICRGKTPVYILPNYTAMLPLRDALRKAAGRDSFWKG